MTEASNIGEAGALDLFIETVWDYYRSEGRHDLPWRQPTAPAGDQFDSYHIWVSELMLQQTQVNRVIPKYRQFLERFPEVAALARAPLADVLTVWSGLGYNRRAKFLWQAADRIMQNYGGALPPEQAALVRLPGIGPNTAGAIIAYAFNRPIVFIETNIRTVFIHHFFADQGAVSDKSLVPLIAATLSAEHPREWYWALMDYGTHLKQTVGNASRASRSYAKQSAFHGSRRQIRGQILKLLIVGPKHELELSRIITDARLTSVLQDLVREGMVLKVNNHYRLSA